MDFHETYILLAQDYYVHINKEEQEYYTYWLLYGYIKKKNIESQQKHARVVM